MFKGGLTRDFQVRFFHDHFPPGPWVSHWGHCHFFENLCLSSVWLTTAISCLTASTTKLVTVTPVIIYRL